MFTVYSALQSVGYREAIILDTEETDNCVQAAYVAHHAPELLCLKGIYQLIMALCLCSEGIKESIIQLHVHKAVITTLFYGKGKKLIADRVQNFADARNLLVECGRQLSATQKVLSDVERFVIRYIQYIVTTQAGLLLR